MRFFRNLITKIKGSRLFKTSWWWGGGSVGSTSGKVVNEFNSMQTTAVYACVRVLAEALASLPLSLMKYDTDGSRQKVTRQDEPLAFVLHDEPNENMTSFSFRETMMTHLLLWGNAFAQIIRNGRGQVISLYPLIAENMEVKWDDDKGRVVYNYTNEKGEVYTLRKEEVLHIPGLSFDGIVGLSPIEYARNAIGMTMAADEFGAKFFANGATPGGVLEHPGTVKDPNALREAWSKGFGGSSNSSKVAVLEEGMKYTQISIPPEQAQFLETRKFQKSEIASIFKVPPHMIGDLENATFSNIEQQSLEFVIYTLDPWLVRWEQALNKALIPDNMKGEYFTKFNVDGLLRGDYASRMNGYAVARQNGWMSANDIRKLEDINTIPAEQGGDDYLINGNMIRLQDAGIYAKGGSQ